MKFQLVYALIVTYCKAFFISMNGRFYDRVNMDVSLEFPDACSEQTQVPKVFSQIQCSRLCAISADCTGFSFTKRTHLCQLCTDRKPMSEVDVNLVNGKDTHYVLGRSCNHHLHVLITTEFLCFRYFVTIKR